MNIIESYRPARVDADSKKLMLSRFVRSVSSFEPVRPVRDPIRSRLGRTMAFNRTLIREETAAMRDMDELFAAGIGFELQVGQGGLNVHETSDGRADLDRSSTLAPGARLLISRGLRQDYENEHFYLVGDGERVAMAQLIGGAILAEDAAVEVIYLPEHA